MTTDITYRNLKEEVIDFLNKNHLLVLATSLSGKVTARTVNCINKDLTVFFQTSKLSVKYQQMQQNPNVALCFGNMQMEGLAQIRRHPLHYFNRSFAAAYKRLHTCAYEKYSNLPDNVVVEVTPKVIALWKNDEKGIPFHDFLYISKRLAARKYISHG